MICIIGNVLHLIAGTVFLLSYNLEISLSMIFFLGIGMGGRVFVGYIFMTENLRVKDVPKVTAAMFTVDSFSIMISAFYF